MVDKQKYIELIQKNIGKHIYIYGAGNAAKIVYRLCKENEISIKGFCVTDISKNVNVLYDIPVLQFDCLQDEEAVILIAIIEHGEKKIRKYIRENGNYEIIDLPENILDYDEWEEQRKRNPAMEITPVIGCSVNCKYCPQKLLLTEYFKDNKDRQAKMSLEQFKKCVQKLPTNTLIEFAGFVEPFLNEESVDMMYYANEMGYKMTLFTTLVGLKENQLEKVLKIPFKQVVLHTADADGYANIPVTEQYLRNLKQVVEAKKADGTSFVDSANCQSRPHEKVIEVTKGKLSIYCEMSDRAGNLDNGEGKLLSADVKGEIYCERANQLNHNILLPDGTVVLCCNDFGMQHVLGNLYTDRYEDIMKSEMMRQIKRGMHIDENIPIICRKCMFAKNM